MRYHMHVLHRLKPDQKPLVGVYIFGPLPIYVATM